ncbi:MAG: type II secretion system protein GspK [Kiritimatiellaeota bacterium]|nr:type II secretion system protein GspK [Kiritimatiellota bacterium]
MPRSLPRRRAGSALIVVLWVLMVLALLVGSLAFDMQLEANLTGYQRSQLQAKQLARAGVEWARYLLTRSLRARAELPMQTGDDETVYRDAIHVARGLAVTNIVRELGAGRFRVDLIPEQAFRNVNRLSDTDWETLLERADVPAEQWPELIDYFKDYTDANEEHRINGAESDDPFYQERGYGCKNAPLDTVDELMMIKGFTKDIVYGRRAARPGDQPQPGIAPWLTVWGTGELNLNAASPEVMMTMDGIEDTVDDGFANVSEVLAFTRLSPALQGAVSVNEHRYMRVVSVGECGDVRARIQCILFLGGRYIQPVFWREGSAP